MKKEYADYLEAYSKTRHFQRKCTNKITNVMKNADIDFGVDGEFYADPKSYGWGKNASDAIDINEPPGNCPGLWCQWVVSKDLEHIEWDGGEKFYNYTEWLNFIIDNFLNKWGYTLSGYVKYQGEDEDDNGYIVIKNNKAIKTKEYNYLE